MDCVKGFMHISVTVRSSCAEEILNGTIILVPHSVQMQLYKKCQCANTRPTCGTVVNSFVLFFCFVELIIQY